MGVSIIYTCDLFFDGGYKIEYHVDMKTEFDWTIGYLKPYFLDNLQHITSCYSVISEYNPQKYIVLENMLLKLSSKYIADHHYKSSFKYTDKSGTIYYKKENMIVICPTSLNYNIVKNSNEYKYCFESARIIREIMTYEMAKRKFVKVHCSAVERDGEAIVFIGNKGAGKTTKMINLVGHGFNFITNDRAFIGFENDFIPCIYSWPGAVSVSVDTLSMFEQFSLVLNHKDTFRFPQWRLEYSDQKYSGKFDFTPIEFCNLFKVNAVSESRIRKIICVNNSNEALNDKEDILKKNILFNNDVSYPDWLGLLTECDFDIDSFCMKIKPYLCCTVIPQNKLETEYNQIMKIVFES